MPAIKTKQASVEREKERIVNIVGYYYTLTFNMFSPILIIILNYTDLMWEIQIYNLIERCAWPSFCTCASACAAEGRNEDEERMHFRFLYMKTICTRWIHS